MLNVTKMHGLGNSYVYISEYEENLPEQHLPLLARAVSSVRTGIGSDGLILIGPSDTADVRMRIFNADGSEAENCGNGLRCVAKYAYEHKYVSREELTIQYKTGVARAWVHPAKGLVERVTVDMGEPQFGVAAVGLAETGLRGEVGEEGVGVAHVERDASGIEYFAVEARGATYRGALVSMGNPHLVMVREDATTDAVERLGPLLERHPAFPNRINVEFVTPLSNKELNFRVWERGSGVTFACGTGACASVAAGIRAGLLDSEVLVHLLGGDLEIRQENGRIFMTGEAKEVIRGQFHWDL